MRTSKWKLGSWKRSSAESRKSDTTPTLSSPVTTRTSALVAKPPSSSSSSSTSGSGGGSSGSSNKSSKTSSSRSSTSSSSSPFSWFRSSPRAKGRRSIISRDDPAFARLHKPFTPQNLEHQKLLSTFEWAFDNEDNNDNDADDEQRRRRRRRRRVSLSLSPCASRDATVDDYAIGYGYGYGPEACHGDYNTTGMLPPNGRRDTLSDSLAHLSMRRASGGGFDTAPII